MKHLQQLKALDVGTQDSTYIDKSTTAVWGCEIE